MGHYDNDARECIQIILQYLQGGNVQIVSRLIQDQNIRCPHQYLAQLQSAPFSTGQFSQLSILVFSGKQEPLQHSRCRDLSVLRGDIFRHITNVINNSLLRMHHGVVDLLGIISQLHGLSDLNMSAVRSHFTQDHFH